MPNTHETIAVLGAGGTMGRPIARNLARAGYAVRAWNRSTEKAEPLKEDGVDVLGSAAEAVRGASVLVTMLSDGDAVLSAVGEAASGLERGTLWLQLSTIGEAGTERCLAFAQDHGLGFVDAPVLGTKQPAEEGKLVVLASGSADLQERTKPIFEAIAQRTMWVGEAGNGSKLKLATNSWITAVVEGAAETLALAEGLGLDPQLVLDAVGGGPLDLPYLQLKGKAMIARDFTPSFALKLAAKDAALVQESAERHGLDLPLAQTIRRRFDEGAAEHGEKDLSATFLTSAPGRGGS